MFFYGRGYTNWCRDKSCRFYTLVGLSGSYLLSYLFYIIYMDIFMCALPYDKSAFVLTFKKTSLCLP